MALAAIGKAKGKNVSYFFGFLGLSGVAAGADFFGLPLPGTLQMASGAALGYMRCFKRLAINTIQMPKISKTTPCISCNIISTSEPCNDSVNYMDYTKSANPNTNNGQYFQEGVLRLLHKVKHTLSNFVMPFERLVYCVKFISNIVHKSNDKGRGLSCQVRLRRFWFGGFLRTANLGFKKPFEGFRWVKDLVNNGFYLVI